METKIFKCERKLYNKKTLRMLTKNDLNPEVLQHEFDSGL